MHRAFGPTGRPGRVDKDRQVLGPAGGHARIELARVGSSVRTTALPEVGEVDDSIVAEVAQAFGIEDDDELQQRQVTTHLERLVELLFILDERMRVLESSQR